jgi:hypothetical protein
MCWFGLFPQWLRAWKGDWEVTFVFFAAAISAGFAERWFGQYFYTRKTLAKHAAHVVATNRCPVCWYDLTAAKPEADGCRVCPECGAAWRHHMPHPAPPAAAGPQSEVERPLP